MSAAKKAVLAISAAVIAASVLVFARLAASAPPADINLIPAEPVYDVPNYVCTWSYQDWWAANVMRGPTSPRKALNAETLFGENGWCKTMYPDIRKDMFFLLDDGWDRNNLDNGTGSQDLKPAKFPGYGDTPQDRLKTLSDNVKACGWKGLGIWVCASEYNDPSGSGLHEDYWRARLEWSKYAGVRYWKVDWGDHKDDNAWKKWLSDTAKEIYPELIVEHTNCVDPLNDKDGKYRCTSGDIAAFTYTLSYSDVFRTYDVTGPLSVASTFDRIGENLSAAYSDGTRQNLMNAEDECYMDAALGLTMGVMRYPIGGEPAGSLPNIFFGGARFPDSRPIRKMLDEVTRAAKWQRVAPAFRADACGTKLADEYLADSWTFGDNNQDTWFDVNNRSITQCAPAVIARGIDLPAVSAGSGDTPFVAASRNPNGAISVATFGRTNNTTGYHTNDTVNVSLNAGDLTGEIGIFGVYGSLSLTFNQSLTGKTVLAQDIMGGKATDITSQVAINGGTITIPGSLINTLGVSAGTPGDFSEPGLVVKIAQRKGWFG